MKIWSSPELKASFNEQNTLLIESDPNKGINYKANMFVLFPYLEGSVKTNFPNNSYYMNKIAEYIVNLLDNADDVTNYLMTTQFDYEKDKYEIDDEDFKEVLIIQKEKLEKNPMVQKKVETSKIEEKREEPKKDLDKETEENIKKLNDISL